LVSSEQRAKNGKANPHRGALVVSCAKIHARVDDVRVRLDARGVRRERVAMGFDELERR
jgi:hypothetical protein